MTAHDSALGEPERLHPLFLLTGLGGALRGLAGGYAFIAYLAVSGRLGTALLGAVALFVLMAVGIYLYWRRFEFRVGENEIRIDSGILSRTHRSIPFDRIQDVSITQGPIARLLGLAAVKFETGGSAGQDEGVLQAIPLQRAQELRELVRARRSAAAAPASEPETDAPPIYAMDLRRLFLAGLFNFSLAVFGALFALTQTVGDVIGFDPFSRRFWNTILSASEPVQQFVLANRAATAVAGILSLVLIGIATGMVRTLLRNYGFRLDRTGSGLRRRRGLLSISDVTLPVSRAQAAILATGPVRDRFGWRELRLQSLARDEGGSGDHVLAPLASDDEAGAIVQALGWRPPDSRLDWSRVSPAYVWGLAAALAPPLFLALIVGALAPMASNGAGEGVRGAQITSFALVTAIAVGLIARWLAWRRTGYVLDGDRLLVRTGWWRRRTLILPLRRIQSMDLVQSFVGRWFGTATLRFGIAGGSSASVNEIPALPEKSARALRRQLLSSIA